MAGGVLAVAVAAVLLVSGRTRGAEVERLTALLSLREGMTVAEIGAGTGWLTIEVARRVGAGGRVFSTEVGEARVEGIRQAAAAAGLTNVTALQAGVEATNLPEGCCQAVFMRRVYHHLDQPAAVLASIREALVPGGRLVIIEFRHDGMLGRVTGMGIERPALVEAVTAAGFEVVTAGEWPGWDHYVAVFAKPEPATSR
jgi:ubiquinone/menaquinone biosynthesis C-methylase UbiE